MHVILVVNARARSGAGELPQRAERALRAAGAIVEVARTEDEDAFAAVCATADGRRVVLLGGDGTVHAAANTGAGADFALLPGGMANNVARALGIPRGLDAAARLAVEGAPRGVDVIAASAGGVARLVVEGLSIGLHAVARTQYRAANSDALVHGLRTAVDGIRRFAGADAEVRIEGGGAETVALGQLFVANLPYYAFGLRVAPQALADDGTFDIVALPPAPRRAVPAQIVRLRRGTHLGQPGVRVWRARSAEIVPHGSPVIADTAALGPGPLRLEARPGALRLIRV